LGGGQGKWGRVRGAGSRGMEESSQTTCEEKYINNKNYFIQHMETMLPSSFSLKLMCTQKGNKNFEKKMKKLKFI
jgi:hypothetical protein